MYCYSQLFEAWKNEKYRVFLRHGVQGMSSKHILNPGFFFPFYISHENDVCSVVSRGSPAWMCIHWYSHSHVKDQRLGVMRNQQIPPPSDSEGWQDFFWSLCQYWVLCANIRNLSFLLYVYSLRLLTYRDQAFWDGWLLLPSVLCTIGASPSENVQPWMLSSLSAFSHCTRRVSRTKLYGTWYRSIVLPTTMLYLTTSPKQSQPTWVRPLKLWAEVNQCSL